MPRFSLIVATINRTEEFATLLRSLAKQDTWDFELIAVDQNSDDRLVPLLKEWEQMLASKCDEQDCIARVKHLRSAPGLSRARNLGLTHSSGDILAFPDDDCWYLPGTLQYVDDWFRQHDEYGILSLGSRDEEGRPSGNRWPQSQCDLTRINAFRATATYTYFVRRPPPGMPLKFDESIGPGAGTPFGAGEDTDLILTLLGNGVRGRFNSLRFVGHPFKPYASVERAESYGGGFGRVLAKHSLALLFLSLVIFDFARAAVHLLLGNRSRASRLWAHGHGIIRAYLSR
jgi:glycosyltransferase involved in cell wall biosynthesis